MLKHYPGFRRQLAEEGRALPDCVQREFEDYLKCGRLEHGFLRVRCKTCHEERLVAFSCKRRGFCPSCGARCLAESSALLVDNVFPHQPVFQWVLSFPFPLRFLFASRPLITGQVLGIFYRVISMHLVRKVGYLRKTARTGAGSRKQLPVLLYWLRGHDGPVAGTHSITYLVAVGPQAGRKVFTLQTLPACEVGDYADTVGKVSGFSLHAGAAARCDERKKPERLCRYISRPAVAEKRLSLTPGATSVTS